MEILTPSIEEIIGRLFKNALFGPDNRTSALISHYLQSSKKSRRKFAIPHLKKMFGPLCNELSEREVEIIINRWFNKSDILFPAIENPEFTFIDLFAGIGGFRIALQELKGECVFTSEWDKDAQKTYYANFGEIPFGDITKAETKNSIPAEFDILCGGFPCQPFSLAGVSKKNSMGVKHGFDDVKQGNLFFEIAEIIRKHRPKVFFLENVKNLSSHDKGNTMRVIQKILFDLEYSVHAKVIDAKFFVPQHRERIFLVGFDNRIFNRKEDFSFPAYPEQRINLKTIIETQVDPKYTLSTKLWEYLQAYALKHKIAGNGFGYSIANLNDPNAHTRTLSARYYKDGSEILIHQNNANPRRLIPRECARLQGYPEGFKIDVVSDVQIYRQFGNSVAIPVIKAIAEQIIPILKKQKKQPAYFLK